MKSTLPPLVPKHPRGCDELGLCQHQFGKPRCPECRLPAQAIKYPFAPGVVDTGEADDGQHMVHNLLLALVAVAAAGLLGGCVIGFCKAVGWLP